jgi:hypothetical protein
MGIPDDRHLQLTIAGLWRRARSSWQQPGRRGTALVLIAAVFAAYGTGLLVGYRPTFAIALNLPVTVFGWVFVGSAVFVAVGAWLRSARWQFAYAVLVMALWALLLATHWTEPYGWAAAVSWMGPCALTVLIAGWPEDRPP